jgi:alpha-ketoglutarate-dependent taurine dioxygenase
MSIAIRPLRPTFAGEVLGVDIAKPLDHADAAAIEAAIDTYAVLVFREQPLTDEQQIAFTLDAPGPALRSQRGSRRAADHCGRPSSGGGACPLTPR